jgi:hypothetical protein
VPSTWGAARFVAAGIDPARVVVVPGGRCCSGALGSIVLASFTHTHTHTHTHIYLFLSFILSLSLSLSLSCFVHLPWLTRALEAVDVSHFDPDVVPRNRSLLPGALASLRWPRAYVEVGSEPPSVLKRDHIL